jgi:DNA-binding transcriptional LysR family regulator
MAIELQQLRQVITLAEHGSFVRAASALNISQPALSRSIMNLEKRIGSELFQRSSSGVVPTDRGRLYIERARDVLRLADDLDREVRAHSSSLSGRVSVGGGTFPAESFLGPAAARFVEQYPRVSVRLQSRNWDELLHDLRSRELDFFVGETSTLHREPDLEIVASGSQHAMHFFARAGHPLASKRTFDVTDVLDWPFAAPSRIPPRVLDPLLAAHRAAARRNPRAPPFPSIQCNGLAPVKRILAQSDAVSATMLSLIADELESGALVLLGTEPWLHLNYGIVSLKGRPWTQHAGAFLGFVLEAERTASAVEVDLATRFGSPT